MGADAAQALDRVGRAAGGRMTDYVVGMDGCRDGWVACVLNQSGDVSFRVVASVSSAMDMIRDSALTLIDIPIGLPPTDARACDLKAKKLLGRYNSRVFLTPPRGVFQCHAYEDANPLCKEISGRGLMKQMWAIMPKIKEVDRAILSEESPPANLRECHPEICFWGLRGTIIDENKTTIDGKLARVATLAELLPDAERVIVDAERTLAHRKVASDDVIDALIGAITAAGVWDGTIRTLPSVPEQDARGLPMEMVYRLAP